MKGLLNSALGLVAVVALGGCMSVNYGLTVNGGGSAVVDIQMLIDNSVIQSSGGQIDTSQMASSTKSQIPNATVKPLKTATQTGVEATVAYPTLDAALADLRADSGSKNTLGIFKTASATKTSSLFGSGYAFNFATTDPSNSKNAQQQAQAAAAAGVTLQFSLTLPEKITSTTGSPTLSADGRTATWKIPLTQSVSFSATADPPGPPLGPIALAMVLILLLAAGAFGITRLRARQAAPVAGPTPAPVPAPAAAVAPAAAPAPAPASAPAAGEYQYPHPPPV